MDSQERGYLNLIQEILLKGAIRSDRTGTGTLSLPGQQLRFDLEQSFPLLTTKRVWWRGVVEELLWMVNGLTDSKTLSDKGIHIWDANASSRGGTDLGPIYGYQWRNFGGKYPERTGGVDQLKEVVKGIKTDPYGRRHIVSSWNPMDLDSMALPPCHCFYQFYVSDGKLTTILYQRSADVGLGVPFNIASYSLLTHMVAHLCGLGVGEFIHNMGDTHIYLNHVEPLKEQLERVPRAPPSLAIVGNHDTLEAFTVDSFRLDGYKPYPTIKMPMAV